MDRSEGEDLVRRIELGKGPGRAKAELGVEFVRELGEADLPAIQRARGPKASEGGALLRLRHSHHQLAQLLARGVEETEASLTTGYSRAYISTLKRDASFQELVVGYEAQREELFADTVRRMSSLGLSALDELQARLDEDGASWTKRELMELADLCLVKGRAPAGAPAGAGVGGLKVEINFVEPPAAGAAGPVIDLPFAEVEGE